MWGFNSGTYVNAAFHSLRLLMQLKLYSMLLVFVLISFAPYPLYGNETAWRSIGLRGGVGINGSKNDEDFKQYEGFTTWTRPWSRRRNSGWTIGTYIEANAGVLRGGGTSAFVGSIGPGIYIKGLEDILEIYMGINPTIISKHKFGDENLGGPIAFTFHVGINFIFAKHYNIGYRLQHMSNGGLYEDNPGLNMHMIILGYRF